MRGQLTINGWSHFRGARLRPGVISNVYRHSETGWFAQEVFRGPANKFAFLTVHDETGKCVGTCKSVQELP
jgi:hypothetical protein